jgi:chromosome segregation ATPase
LAKIKEKLRERQQQHVKVLRDRENLAIFGFLLLWCPVRDANEKCEVLMKQIERIDKNVAKMTDDIEQEDVRIDYFESKKLYLKEKRKLLMDAEREKKEEIDAVKKEARMFEEKCEVVFKQRQISKRHCEQCMQNVNEHNENVVKEQSDIHNLTKQIDILRRAAYVYSIYDRFFIVF